MRVKPDRLVQRSSCVTGRCLNGKKPKARAAKPAEALLTSEGESLSVPTSGSRRLERAARRQRRATRS
jgi:hypothetical protein